MRRMTTVWAAAVMAMMMGGGGCASGGGEAAQRDPASVKQVVYVTTTSGKTLLAYDLDPVTGALTERQRLDLPANAGPVAVTPDGGRLYVGMIPRGEGAGTQPLVQAFDIDRATGQLTPGPKTDFEHYPTYLDVDATGRWLLSAYYGPGLARVHALASGEGSGAERYIKAEPVQTVTLEKNAHAILLDESNRFAYVPATGPNRIWQFRFDAESGRLTALDPTEVMGGESGRGKQGPRHYVYHPTLDRLYAVNELDSSVTVYRWDRKAGTLEPMQSLPTLPDDFDQRNTCADIHVTPDGRYVYASNRGHNSLAAYAVDAQTGELTFIDRFETEDTPREFEVDLTGRFVYAAGQKSHKIAAYRIDPSTGRLERMATYETPEGPIWVMAVEVGE